MKKFNNIIQTREFKRELGWEDNFDSEANFTYSNIDIFFTILCKMNITEIEVTLSEFYLIVNFVANTCSQTEYGSQAMKTGKVDEFMGIKLILEK